MTIVLFGFFNYYFSNVIILISEKDLVKLLFFVNLKMGLLFPKIESVNIMMTVFNVMSYDLYKKVILMNGLNNG